MNRYFVFFFLFFSTSLIAKSSFLDSVQRLKWGDLDVVWIEDDKFPKFAASIYFEDGAISDQFSGLTEAMFDQMTSGTSKENQRELAEFFDFYGANIKHSVTHEYSILSLQALTKDIEPVVGKMCELMNDAQYPEKELKSYVSRAKSNLKNLITSHASLADRIFRATTLKGTPYETPVEGSLKSFNELNSLILKERLKRLNKTRKVLYLAGPSESKNIRKVLEQKCIWSNEIRAKRTRLKKPASETVIYLVPVTGANQAQIRIGRYLGSEEVESEHDKYGFLAGFLGGGFTSKLVQELRVKRGLTYSANSYVSLQRDYGRAGVVTFSKNETAANAISIISDVFKEISLSTKIEIKEFKHQQGHQIGGYAFGFEATNAFLGQIMLYDHQGRSIKELANFPETIAALTPEDLANVAGKIFSWEKLIILVVGDEKLKESLSKIGPVKVLNYKDYL